MRKYQKLITALMAVILCIMTVLAVLDTEEIRYETNFDQDMMYNYIENLTANGSRSIYDTEENQKALDYIVEMLESWGL